LGADTNSNSLYDDVQYNITFTVHGNPGVSPLEDATHAWHGASGLTTQQAYTVRMAVHHWAAPLGDPALS
jgi:hypothetical protein